MALREGRTLDDMPLLLLFFALFLSAFGCFQLFNSLTDCQAFFISEVLDFLFFLFFMNEVLVGFVVNFTPNLV